jgi:cytoskeletal protein CcmA (bactofilin family)
VNPYLAVAALVFTVSLMLVLPLVPAMAELGRRSDARPLNVDQQNAGEIRHFAHGFRAHIKALEPTILRCVGDGTNTSCTLSDGEEYVVLGRVDEPLLIALRERDAIHPVVIAAGVDLVVPPQGTFSKDLYAAGHLTGGEKNNYRTIFCDREVHLGAASRVMRWAHAIGQFTAEAGCRLYGRISSDSILRLHPNCTFLRLNAPRIEFGPAATGAEENSHSSSPAKRKPGRFLHDGDFEVLAGQVITSDLIIRGKLRICSGSRICGSVKSIEDMVIEDGVAVEGSLISARKMRIGPGCAIHGPVVAEHELAIAAGTRFGTLEHPTTVTSPEIEVEEGVVVFGTLWARERGRVVASQ